MKIIGKSRSEETRYFSARFHAECSIEYTASARPCLLVTVAEINDEYIRRILNRGVRERDRETHNRKLFV